MWLSSRYDQQISVEKVALKSSEVRAEEISRAVEMADAFLRAGRETLIMSSRELITGKSCFSVPTLYIFLLLGNKVITEGYHH